MDNLLCMCAMMLVWVCLGVKLTGGQVNGFSLNGKSYLDGSTVLREDIGEGDSALLCTTDIVECCTNRIGEFYFPNGTQVPVLNNIGSSGYYRNRDDRLIRLNRQSPAGVLTGKFRCEIPAGSNTLMINIVDILASITPSGDATAGQIYDLVCSVNVTGSTDQPTITWLVNNTDISSDAARTVSMTNGSAGRYSSTLTFNPLAISHPGTYTCKAMLGGAEVNESIVVVIKETPTTEAPTTEAPTTTEGPTTEASTTEAPTTEAPTTEAPTTEAPTTEAPTTEAPTTEAPTTEAPTTEAPTTEAPTTTAPTSEVPTTRAPTTTEGPTTEAPTTEASTTEALTTEAPTTAAPTSEVPTSEAPTTTEASSPPTVASTTEVPSPRVYLSLNGTVYADNSVIPITEIGNTSNTGLQCITDRRPCCGTPPNRHGEWYFPDGTTTVPAQVSASSFYRSRGDDGTVTLNRLNTNVMSPTGQFCCEVPDGTETVQTLCADIVNIVITPTGTPTAGETFSLNCSVTGTDDSATYQWFDSNGTQLINISQLQFSPLRASEGGAYSCRATVRGVVVEGTATVTVNYPAPTAVSVTPPVDMIIAGSSPILTCTVELSPLVDILVNVTTEWTGPGGTTFRPNKLVSAVMVNLTTYISTVTVDVARNGSYICEAAINSGGTMSGSTVITLAPLPPPTNLVATPMTTSIRLTWDPPGGADDVPVNSYEINYEYSVNQCSDEGGSFPPVTIRMIDGSLREYTVENSTITPVEEDSDYTITLTAVNSVDRSEPSNIATATTAMATPGPPSSLIASSISISSITIQWDPVPCQDQNRPFGNYRITYYPSSDPNAGDVMIVGENDRVFPLAPLPPRTNYTFEVQALDSRNLIPGLSTTLIVSTSEPSRLGFLLDGVLYLNNSVVTVTEIGSSFFMSALFCLTPSLECCGESETPNAANVSSEWYLPDGRAVTSANSPFIKSRVPSSVSLHRDQSSSVTAPSGVFRCEIPDASGASQNIYVGVYPQEDGIPLISSVVFDRNSTTLVCTSTRGPPATVTWKKNSVPVNASVYQQSQRLVDAETAMYENALFNADVANFVGSFTCEVSNARGVDDLTVELNGVSIVPDTFNVGQSATARCISDTLATQIEWLTQEDVVVLSATSTKQLDLNFSPVNDSIQNQVYVCRVTREGGMIGTQNFTVDVVVPLNAITATVSSSGIARAGRNYNLTCTVSKTVDGLINSPTATWTIGGVAITNRNGITVSNITDDTASISTLIFDPLRTSHGAQYRCSGFFMSPARDTALMPYVDENVNIQISTPDVSVTVPRGPLFAGSITPLTLTCNIFIRSATDTAVAVMDTDVMWMRGNTPLSNSDARVTISAVSGSRPSFTSTLTLHPLSTVDNSTFTCIASARPPPAQQGFLTASETGELTTSVIVNLPSPPVVRINPFNGVALAGESLTVNCSVIPQEGIMYNNNTISVLWSMGGGTPLPMEEDSGAMIFISSVRTSHGGRYTCTARLYIPEARVDVSGTNATAVNVQIPTPTLTITGSPRNSGFFRGLILTFTCLIEIGSSVDTGVTVEARWGRNGTLLEDSSDERITVISSGLAESPYQTRVRFNATDFEDAGIYNCSARIIPRMSEFILEQTGFVTRAITVLNFPPQDVGVVDEGVSTAGYSGYTLVCTTDRDADLNPASTLTIQWLDSDGTVISSGDDLSISGTQGPVNDDHITSRLTFNSLMTSQAGLYTCRTLLTIPGTVVDHIVVDNFTVTVKLPAPEVVTIYESRNAPIYEGTMFSLTCLITPNMTGVDTDVTIERNFTGPRTSDANRVTPEDTQFQTTLTFRPVAMTDGGRYVCSASAISTSQYPNVKDSTTTMNDSTISIAMLPPPVVMITAPPTPTGGQSYTLGCSARTEDYVISVPSVEWVNIGSTGITQPPQTNGTVSANRSLTFNPIRTSHGDSYTCQATVNIPLANVSDRSSDTSQDVRVLIPTSEVMVNKGDFQPYNGTVFSLTGVLQLNTSIVDTDVTVMWVWSLNGRELDTQTTSASPHEITISFNPLATNSSGLYSLNLTIMPNNPLYVRENSDSSTTYNLNVLSLPAPVLSIAITSRVADRCSEAMTFTCTATTVDNLFTPPRIEWRYNGNVVPDSGNPQMNSTTGQLIFSNITNENSGDYTCRAIVSIQESDIDNHYNETSTAISTDMPAKVENLMCVGDSGDMSLTISWGEPMAQGSGVVGYSVEAQKVEQLPSRELRSVPLSPAYDVGVEETRAQVTQELESETPYNITVKALNLAGCGEEQQIFCFTEEGRPPIPQNVTVVRINDTALTISWYKFTLVELKGLATYIITYTVSGGSRKRQTNQMVTAMWFENNKTIGGLPPRQAVSLQVYTFSSGGRSDETVRMLEAVPTDSGMAVIVGAIIAVILAILAVVITMIIIVILVRRYRVSRKFSPRHNMYDVSSKSEERELQLHPIDNGSSQPAMNDKEKEALEESAIVPPPTQPRSAITTEVMDRMKPVSMTSFRDHVAARHEDRDKGFESEYQSFGTDPVNSHEIAKLPINRPKNRFANIFPYDHSRVELNELPGEEGSDYINACSLGGYKRKECYIAAQGPMPNTISDFWRMVWEKRLPNIVMLTKCLEAGRRKCEQYWADNIGEDYQTPDKKLNITTTSVMPYADFVIRTFSVKSLTNASLDPLSVTHYHFTSWPDHGVPKFATSLISFIRRVQRGHTKDSGRQLLVHCSAGVGRTGTLITLDSMLDRMAAKEPDVNVYEFVYHMRQRRVLMVQTLAQYVFIHDALNELITCGQTDIVASALRTKVNFLSKVIPAKGITGFQNQFQLLEQVSRLPVDEDLTDAMEPYNQSKNRYPDKIPYNMSRARLRPTGEDGSEYINASFIDGYKQRNAYIATQGPLQHTVNDIWRMLYEFKSRTLVMLCNMNEDGSESSYPYFPSKEEEAVKYGKMVVTLQSKASYTDFIVRKFSIQEDKQGSPKNDGFVVTQFHLTEWPLHQVPNTGTLIEMLDMVTKNQMSTGNRPITVMCNDGVGRTGTFICIHAQLERLKTEGVVDFFQSIKSARIQRAGLVPDVDQYAFCHTVLADYIDKFDNYANFKDMI